MRHIKIFEDFNSKLNEAKETPLPGGFINANFVDDDSSLAPKNGVIYFQTTTTTPSKNLGSPGNLEITVTDGKTSKGLEFSNNNFVDTDRVISWKFRDFAKMRGGQENGKDSVLAKNPAEASSKAYEILLNSTYLTPTPGDPKVLGNILRAFFEIRKMYPDYMTKNDLFKGFLNGIINQYPKPNFGMFTSVDEFSDKIKGGKYLGEISAVLREVGVIKDAK